MGKKNWIITKDQFLTASEIQKLYQALHDAKDIALQRKRFFSHIRDYFILRTLLETGLRIFELAALHVSDFHSGSLIVRKGKGGKKRNIILTRDTQKMLAEFLKLKVKVLGEPIADNDFLFLSERGQAYSTRGLRKRVKFWFSNIGISSDLSCHSCRHSYVSHMLAAGVDLVTVRDNAGHSSLAVTSVYSHAIKNDLGELELYRAASRGSRNNSKKKNGQSV